MRRARVVMLNLAVVFLKFLLSVNLYLGLLPDDAKKALRLRRDHILFTLIVRTRSITTTFIELDGSRSDPKQFLS